MYQAASDPVGDAKTHVCNQPIRTLSLRDVTHTSASHWLDEASSGRGKGRKKMSALNGWLRDDVTPLHFTLTLCLWLIADVTADRIMTLPVFGRDWPNPWITTRGIAGRTRPSQAACWSSDCEASLRLALASPPGHERGSASSLYFLPDLFSSSSRKTPENTQSKQTTKHRV